MSLPAAGVLSTENYIRSNYPSAQLELSGAQEALSDDPSTKWVVEDLSTGSASVSADAAQPFVPEVIAFIGSNLVASTVTISGVAAMSPMVFLRTFDIPGSGDFIVCTPDLGSMPALSQLTFNFSAANIPGSRLEIGYIWAGNRIDFYPAAGTQFGDTGRNRNSATKSGFRYSSTRDSGKTANIVIDDVSDAEAATIFNAVSQSDDGVLVSVFANPGAATDLQTDGAIFGRQASGMSQRINGANSNSITINLKRAF